MKDDGKSPMIVLGVGGAPHGLKGELRIKTFTDDPLAIGSYGPLTGSDGKTYRLLTVRAAKTVVIARLDGVNGREQAETLNGVEFSVSREALSAAGLGEEEFFHADLIGLSAVDDRGGRYGRVSAIHDFGGGDMLELAAGGGKSVMIPFSKAAVPIIDPGAGTIVIDPAAAGLADDEGDDQ